MLLIILLSVPRGGILLIIMSLVGHSLLMVCTRVSIRVATSSADCLSPSLPPHCSTIRSGFSWELCVVMWVICSGRDTKFIKAGSKAMYEGRANDDRRSSMGWGMLRTGTHSSRRGLLLVLTAHEVGLRLGGGSSGIHVMASGSQLHHRDGQTDLSCPMHRVGDLSAVRDRGSHRLATKWYLLGYLRLTTTGGGPLVVVSRRGLGGMGHRNLAIWWYSLSFVFRIYWTKRACILLVVLV